MNNRVQTENEKNKKNSKTIIMNKIKTMINLHGLTRYKNYPGGEKKREVFLKQNFLLKYFVRGHRYSNSRKHYDRSSCGENNDHATDISQQFSQ